MIDELEVSKVVHVDLVLQHDHYPVMPNTPTQHQMSGLGVHVWQCSLRHSPVSPQLDCLDFTAEAKLPNAAILMVIPDHHLLPPGVSVCMCEHVHVSTCDTVS